MEMTIEIPANPAFIEDPFEIRPGGWCTGHFWPAEGRHLNLFIILRSACG